MYMQNVDKKKFHMFAVTLDMDAYRKVTAEGIILPSGRQIVAEVCAYIVLGWYCICFPGLISEAHYFFDADEPFEEIVKSRWNKERNNLLNADGMREAWQMIRTVANKEMKLVPGLQAADMLAWGSNRNLTAEDGEVGKYYHYIMKQVIANHWTFIDENRLRTGTWKPLGLSSML